MNTDLNFKHLVRAIFFAVVAVQMYSRKIEAHGSRKKITQAKSLKTREIGRTTTQHVNKNGVRRDTMDENGKRMTMTI